MANTNFKSVDEYIATKPGPVQIILERVRSTIRKAIPEADEVISYQLPAYKLKGRPVIYFAGWKEHYSVYPATGGLIEAFQKELAGYEISKGTIRFPLSKPVPVRLIARIAKFRASLAVGELAAKQGARRK
jgi:uncharacterized protein YdhG (YjbR/CyaY superfamily)